MTPLSIPSSMETFTDTCPSGLDLLRVAREGGQDACAVLARTWISEGIPVAFARCPAVYDAMRVWLARELSVHPKQIGLTGSARFGSSFVARKAGQSFGPGSDLDIFVVSESLFCAYGANFVTWRDDFRSGKIEPRNSKERGHWEENAELVARNIGHGFIDVRFIPSYPRYKVAQRTLDAMFRLVEKLKMTPRSPSPQKASVRCYVSWSELVKQVTLSLKRSSRRL